MRTYGDTFTRAETEYRYCNVVHPVTRSACTRDRRHPDDVHVAHDVTDDGQCEIWEVDE